MNIGLFIPCYVDALYPEVGIATYKLLKHLNFDVAYPEKQTCCGQPMANAGFEQMSTPLAEKYDDMFKDFDYVVAPSASCAAFVRVIHPRLLKGTNHPCLASPKTVDIVEFLHDIVKVQLLPGSFPHVVSVHNSCHGVRELGLSSPSEQHLPEFNKIIDLLKPSRAITVMDLSAGQCAGFGGMFGRRGPDVSNRMGQDKIEGTWQGGRVCHRPPTRRASCTWRPSQERGKPIKFVHVAEILAEDCDELNLEI
jgi:L-lactate dehydrogenase complex protein LldE